ncbi:SANT/Myb domain-containing protein [Fodinisporobacter ferrooxydans]|uniref:SANT/Myb domain-containing protein n=1 Tax=Fodinisporobacter ferrooxydans TaxID=2901836 RepID=A0ABY4CQ43_9BACL|nr:SANT/Myb domain-containing protein [Alicyclobacillaceae bacterium MYW30-H2]
MLAYTPQEDQIIINFYGRIPMNELAKMLPDRTEHAIRSRIRRLRGTSGRRKKGTAGSTKIDPIPNVRNDPIDSYTNELYVKFIKYVEQARHLTSEQKAKPDINHMMRVFRDIHGRFSTEENQSETLLDPVTEESSC